MRTCRCVFVLCITVSLAEMVCWNPISSPFIRFAGRYVDEAFGVAVGWNFFIFQAAMVPFEMVACNVIIKFWDVDDKMPVGAVIAIVMVLYWYEINPLRTTVIRQHSNARHFNVLGSSTY